MTSTVDIVNRALQSFGTRTTVTSAELANNTTNEAIQANLVLTNTRDDLLRMAPWDCAMNTANLTYITSAPGTPENTSAATTLWAKGQPAPPWAYEYQYPVDCLRACFIIPATQTGFSGGIPITTAVTGGAAQFWQGPPVRFKVTVDQFYMVTGVAVSNGGTGYAVTDRITLATVPTVAGTTSRIGTFLAGAPQGAGAVLEVTTVGGGGAITAASVVNLIAGAATPSGGSYFYLPSANSSQDSTSGSGTGAVFILSFGATPVDQRVILTNQEFATLAYVKQVTDPNVMDTLFQSAWIQWLGANLCIALTGDKQLANMCIQLANRDIEEARKADGNEGLTINDVMPDWIRTRGINWTEYSSGPYSNFDWGGLLPLF